MGQQEDEAERVAVGLGGASVRPTQALLQTRHPQKQTSTTLKRHWHCNALEHACSSIATVLFADAFGL